MDRVPVPQLLKELSRFFTTNGYEVCLVGGAVRDLFLDKQADDWDIATNATPGQVATLFKRIIPTGIEHGTVTIPFRDKMIECTTYRTEEGYSDGRRPDAILYASSIEEDLSRRDFTMNAIAVSLPDGKVFDPFNGRSDIKARLIRTVGNACERFAEDGLRPLRAVRFASQLHFSIHPDTLSAIQPALDVTVKVASERIRDELIKTLLSPTPSIGLRFMETTGLLNLILPEAQACRGVEQKGFHRFDVLDHLYLTCDACQQDSLELRLAGFLHDIGKPVVRNTTKDGVYTFYDHEKVSAKIAESILIRLRFPLKTVKAVCHLIAQHMFHYESNWTDAAIRRFIVRTGENYLEPLYSLRRADSFGMTGIPSDSPLLEELQDRVKKLQALKQAINLKDLAINGSDLMSAGIPAGRQTGMILNELLEAVLDDPDLNTRERLLGIALAIWHERFNQGNI